MRRQRWGVANGFHVGGTHLEKSYHHWFTNDVHIMQLTEELEQAEQMDYTYNFFKLLDLADLCAFRRCRCSIDNAHGRYPNFADRYEANQAPLLNRGVVIKANAIQHDTITSEISAIFRKLATDVEASLQTFGVRSDITCGSTIGRSPPAQIGVP